MGDSKVTWELNRHQHLVTLAKAYRLTEDRRYADEIFQQWRHWHAENPYPFGINWVSSLEVAFRSLSWIWMYQLLEGTPVMPREFRKEWLRAQALNGRHIERYLSTYFSPNTHLLGEAVALLFLGIHVPGNLSGGTLEVSWDGKSFCRRVAASGPGRRFPLRAIDLLSLFTRSTSFLHAVVLASLNELAFPAEFEKTIEKMMDALLLLGTCEARHHSWATTTEDGCSIPGAIEASICWIRSPREPCFSIVEISKLRLRSYAKRRSGSWENRALPNGISCRTQQPGSSSASLQSAGLHLLATSNPHKSIIGRWRSTRRPRRSHGHADALSVCLHSQGHALLVDPGTFEYVGDGKERDLFRSTAMHNTLRVDGESQSEPAGPFAWKQFSRAKTEQWITGENFDLFVGSHDGYGRLRLRWCISAGSSR